MEQKEESLFVCEEEEEDSGEACLCVRKRNLGRAMWKLTVPFVLGRVLQAVRPRTSAMVSVVRLSGPITDQVGALSLTTLNQTLENTFAMRPACVVLQINCPGGSPVQSFLLAKRIRSLAKESGVPTLAFAEDVAASGGYMLACAADEIHASPSSLVGSVGVVYSSFGFHDTLARLGAERRLYTTGENKVLLDPYSARTGEQEARLRQLLEALHADFVALVRAWRGNRLCFPDEGVGKTETEGGGHGECGGGATIPPAEAAEALAAAAVAKARAKGAAEAKALVQARLAQAHAREATTADAGVGVSHESAVGLGADTGTDTDKDAGAGTDAERIFSGEAFTGTEALALGLVDGLGTMHEVLAERFKQKGQVPEFWYVNRKPRLFPSLRGIMGGGAGISGSTAGAFMGHAEAAALNAVVAAERDDGGPLLRY